MARSSIISNKGLDWISLTVYVSLVIIGWLMLYAVNYDPQGSISVFDFNSSLGKQSIWIIISFFVFALSFTLDWKFWSTFSFLVYAISIASLLLVLVFGTEVKGAQSWFILSGISFQPSELAKFGTALALAGYLSLSNVSIKNNRNLGIAFGMFLLPAFLIMLQPDAGSALVFFSFVLLFYRAGLNPIFYLIGFGLITVVILSLMYGPFLVMIVAAIISTIVLSMKRPIQKTILTISLALPFIAYLAFRLDYLVYFVIILSIHLIVLLLLNLRDRNYGPALITGIALGLSLILSFSSDWVFNNVLKPHQQERINVWLRPDKCDPRGSLYNIIQSKTAIGSGGISGKGFLNGSMTQLNYIPEQQTDFIFATIGEEQGFIGVFGVIILYAILLTRLIVMSERAKNNFIRYFGYSVTGILFMHFFVNIGMTMGIMPVIGIPLPFLSKGGSSLLIFSLMLGVMLKMDMDRSRTI